MGMDFKKIEKYVIDMSIDHDILEIGSGRGLENSTDTLSIIAARNNKTLYSVDVEKNLIDKNRIRYADHPVEFFNATGEDFLDQHSANLRFSVVLLDNFDWDWWVDQETPDFAIEQQHTYKTDYNVEMNNVNSQTAHLLQAIKLTDMLAEQCVIVCDDSFWIHERQTYSGKCGAAIPYLMSLGFIPHLEEAGVILVRG
jgi:hypothetical protein